MSQFRQFFEQLCDKKSPYAWQQSLAEDAVIRNRLISIPTGFGKTIGVASAWIYQRVIHKNPDWPRRLVWCLPMRTLVEQTAEALHTMLVQNHIDIDVHILMGGEDTRDYHLTPQKDAILVGTQDMLLSRALNRGYGAARARWPMEFALLNNDCLWVLDEVQLMDAGLITSVQLQQFRNEDADKMERPSYSWWMSATLQPSWLKSVDSEKMIESLQQDILTLSEQDKAQLIWSGTSKSVVLENVMDDKALGNFMTDIYQQHENDTKTILLVVNTVKRALAVYDFITKKLKRAAENVRLIHSRYRGYERNQWREDFLNKDKFNRLKLIIATQVIEAGVDISVDILITDLAPWSSLIQRFGRCARYGGMGEIHVIDIDTAKANSALPYDAEVLKASKDYAISALEDASIASLDLLDASLELKPDVINALYPYEPQHLIVRHELDELFDTTADLTGADLDVSRFIRSGVERDCSIFWCNLDNVKDAKDLKEIKYLPYSDELCSIPVYELDSFLKKVKEKKKDIRFAACAWNYLTNEWEELRTNIQPGRIVMLNQRTGGYHLLRGFTGDPTDAVTIIPSHESADVADYHSDLAQNTDNLSLSEQYITIAQHDADTIQWGRYLCNTLGITEKQANVLLMALSFHDYGKCHPQFQCMIKDNSQVDLAKAPSSKWTAPKENRWIRHELASALGVIELLAQTNPMHPAILGEWKEYIDIGIINPIDEEHIPSDVGHILEKMSKEEFNLLVYLIAAHHGKVRASLHATPDDQKYSREIVSDQIIMPIRGIYDGDHLPPIDIALPDNSKFKTPEICLHLDVANMGLSNRYGASWSERVDQIMQKYGPFQLSWLESLIRVADIQTSKGMPVPSSF